VPQGWMVESRQTLPFGPDPYPFLLFRDLLYE
jgi:hypothetical protein